jgi:hypothetical protein
MLEIEDLRKFALKGEFSSEGGVDDKKGAAALPPVPSLRRGRHALGKA